MRVSPRGLLFLVALLGLAGASSGCRMSDALFGVLGNHYTDEGGTVFDKQRHFENRVEAWNDYEGAQ